MIKRSIDLERGDVIEFMDNTLRWIQSVNVTKKEVEIIFCDGYKYIMSLKEDVLVTGKADEEFINDISLKIK